MNLLPPLGLVAVIGGFWGWAWYTERRFKAAIAQMVSQFAGRYEPGGHLSAGTLYLKLDGRDVVFSFDRASSLGPARTTVGAIHARTEASPLTLKGAEAVARVPRLGPYTRWFQRVVLRFEPNTVGAIVAGVVRDAAKLAELAEITATLAAERERSISPP